MANSILFIVVIALLLGVIIGLLLVSNRQTRIEITGNSGNRPEANYPNAGLIFLLLAAIVFAAFYFTLKDYIKPSTTPGKEPVIIDTPINKHEKEDTTTILLGSMDSKSTPDLPNAAPTKNIQPENKVYFQFGAYSIIANLEKALAYYCQQFKGHRIIGTDIPDQRGNYICLIELSQGYDKEHFLKNHTLKVPLKSKAELQQLCNDLL
jgi:hypothetical protein